MGVYLIGLCRYWRLSLLLLMALPACGQSHEARGTREAALLKEWQALATHARDELENPRASVIAAELALLRPEGVEPILRVLEDPGAEPEMRVFAATSIEGLAVLDDDGSLLLNRVASLLDATDNATTRACALHILANGMREEDQVLFQAYVTDEDPRVRLAAWGGLARQGDDNAVEMLAVIARDAMETPAIRDRAFYELAYSARPDLDALSEALDAPFTTISTRLAIADTLARLGTAVQLDAIRRKLAGQEVASEEREALKTTMRAILARISEGQE